MYVIYVFATDGTFYQEEHTSFLDMFLRIPKFGKEFPGAHILVRNTELSQCGFDGLTPQERGMVAAQIDACEDMCSQDLAGPHAKDAG